MSWHFVSVPVSCCFLPGRSKLHLQGFWAVCGYGEAGYWWLNGKKTLKTDATFSFEALLKNLTAKRCGLAYSFLLPASQHEVWCQSNTISLTSAEVFSADKYHIKSVSSDCYYSPDHHHMGHVPSVCENPAAVFHSWCWFWKHKWRRISGSPECICGAQCLHWNKSLWIHCSFPQCLLRDVSLLDSIFVNIYLLQRLVNLTARQFVNWRVQKVDTYFLLFCDFWLMSGQMGDFTVTFSQSMSVFQGPKWKTVSTEFQTLNSHLSMGGGGGVEISLMVAQSSPVNNSYSGELSSSCRKQLYVSYDHLFSHFFVWIAEKQTFPTTNCVC